MSTAAQLSTACRSFPPGPGAVRQAGRVGTSTWLSAAADLVLGATCPGCGQPGAGVCRGCREELRRQAPSQEQRGLPDWPRVWAAARYEGVTRSLIGAHKERGARSGTAALGEALARAVAALLLETAVVEATLVPVPSRPATVRGRGYDSVLLLARAAAAHLRRAGARVWVRASLHQVRPVADQAGLGTAARLTNLVGALRADQLRGPVLVVDDVVTTGATVLEAQRALVAAEAQVLGAAAVAATRLRSSSQDSLR